MYRVPEADQSYRKRLVESRSGFNMTEQQRLTMSHINSYGRNKFGGKSPAEILSSLYGKEMLRLLWHEQIAPENIVLNPSLLNR